MSDSRLRSPDGQFWSKPGGQVAARGWLDLPLGFADRIVEPAPDFRAAIGAAADFLAESGVRFALGGGAALSLRGAAGDPVRDADFLVDRLPDVPTYLKVIDGASNNDGRGIDEVLADGGTPYGLSLEVLGLKVDLVPVGVPYAACPPTRDEELGWIGCAEPLQVDVVRGGRLRSVKVSVPTMRVRDVLTWKWRAGREKDVAFLAAMNPDPAALPADWQFISELAAAARAVVKLQAPAPSAGFVDS